MRSLVLLALALMSSPGLAQEHQPAGVWEPGPGDTATFAAVGFDLIGTASLSWSDGRQSMVTFWTHTIAERSFTYRCVTHYDVNLVVTGDNCEKAELVGE